MTLRLVVHVGANKTGSSAIQTFLAANHAALRERGFLVPDTHCGLSQRVTGWQIFYFEELFRDAQGAQKLEEALAALEKQLPDDHSVLISAENLAANPAAPGLFKTLAGRYDIRLMLYVRRQDEYLLSTWKQWHSKLWTDFWAWLVGNLGNLGNWRNYLKRWEEAIPRENITVRVYERPRLTGGDAVKDYLTHSGIGLHDDFRYPEATVNPSFSDAVLDLVAGNRFIFENAHDNKFYHFVQEMTGDRYIADRRASPITFAQRKAIIKSYDACNAWVRDAYFPGSTAPLFTPPEEGDYTYVPPEALEPQKMEFLISLIYAMYRKRNT